MNFFKQNKLYRIEITSPCNNSNGLEKQLSLNFQKNPSGIGYQKFDNVIPIGITGWVIKWLGKKYFAADDNQPGLESFLRRSNCSDELNNVLIPYNRIDGHYKII